MTLVRNSGRKKKKRLFNNYFDYTLLFVTLFLVFFGLVMIYSSSAFIAQRNFDDSMRFFNGQLRAALLGFLAILIMSKLDYRIFTKKLAFFSLAQWLYVASIILLTAVLFMGNESHGQSRWISLGPISFQPSEVAKVAIILCVAYRISKSPARLNKAGGTTIVLLSNAAVIGLVLVGNLSTAIILAAIVFALCFVTSKKYAPFGLLIGLGVILVICVLLFGAGYRMERVQIWRDIEGHEKGYQILQGLYAIASGGLFGKGLGASMQKLGQIPEVQTDMIFVVICEELGIVGAIAVIFLFVLLLYRIFVIAINAPDLFGSLIATGVFTHIAVQFLINIAVVTNSIPSTGVPLPFISYGGTSLSILLAEVGLVLSVSNRIRHERK